MKLAETVFGDTVTAESREQLITFVAYRNPLTGFCFWSIPGEMTTMRWTGSRRTGDTCGGNVTVCRRDGVCEWVYVCMRVSVCVRVSVCDSVCV